MTAVVEAGAFRLQGLDGVLEMLQKLPPELVSKRGGPIRAALRRGAAVFVKAGRANLQAAINDPGKSGITDTTGFTAKNVIARSRKPPEGIKGEAYVVTVRYLPHATSKGIFRKRRIKVNDIAFIMEAGTAKQPATPWLRPAFLNNAERVIAQIEIDTVRSVERIAQRYLRGA